ncbi:MAG: branched-chain amino acid aminotransferase [Bacteroidia bacterium]
MNILESSIQIKKVKSSRISEVNMNKIPFGRIFSDHMLVARYDEGKWYSAEIVPYEKLAIAPSVSALHYGQAVFEGMKAFRGPLGDALLFRPEENFKRLNRSAHRLCMPEIPESIFMNGLKELVNLDQAWIPSVEQGSLYIRPLYFATDEYIGVKASQSYMLAIMTCPVGAYYNDPVNLLATTEYIRAAIGGTGAAKAAGNYAGSLWPDKIAKEHGYNNILWLDAKEHQYIEECGTMNIFFVIDDRVVTPRLTGTILQGVTRDSVLRVLRDNGYHVEERQISIYEIQAAYDSGSLKEAFGTGTAVTVMPVGKIGFNGRDMVLPPVEDRPVSNWLADTMADIRNGVIKDPYGWVVKV